MSADLTKELGDLIRKSLPAELGDSLRAELTGLQGAREKLAASEKRVAELTEKLAKTEAHRGELLTTRDAQATREKQLCDRECAVQKRENAAAILEAKAANEQARREDTFRLVETIFRNPVVKEERFRSGQPHYPAGGGGYGTIQVNETESTTVTRSTE